MRGGPGPGARNGHANASRRYSGSYRVIHLDGPPGPAGRREAWWREMAGVTPAPLADVVSLKAASNPAEMRVTWH